MSCSITIKPVLKRPKRAFETRCIFIQKIYHVYINSYGQLFISSPSYCGISSVGSERYVDIVEVAGSSPVFHTS